MTKEMEKRAIKEILTHQNWFDLKKHDVDLEFILHLYHEIGRDGDKLNRKVSELFKKRDEETEIIEPIKRIERNIELLKKEIETNKELKKGLIQDHIEEETDLTEVN